MKDLEEEYIHEKRRKYDNEAIKNDFATSCLVATTAIINSKTPRKRTETETEQLKSCSGAKFVATGPMIMLKGNYLLESSSKYSAGFSLSEYDEPSFSSWLSLRSFTNEVSAACKDKLMVSFDSQKTGFKGALSGLIQILANESPLKMMKNAFYFTSKALFVLKIFKFLS